MSKYGAPGLAITPAGNFGILTLVDHAPKGWWAIDDGKRFHRVERCRGKWRVVESMPAPGKGSDE